MKNGNLVIEFENNISSFPDDWVRSESFAKGEPIYYREAGITHGIIKEYPNGKREVVILDKKYREKVVESL